jgi:DNA-binding NtrC family response regulator
MRLDLQAKLLRVLQEQEFERVGGTSPIRVDVRIIATTNRDLAADAAAGHFRQDLYYRLSVIPVMIAPLRERPDDIPVLAYRFAMRTAAEIGKDVQGISPEAIEILQRDTWPGNVRELQHAVERAVILSAEPVLQPHCFDGHRFGLTHSLGGPLASSTRYLLPSAVGGALVAAGDALPAGAVTLTSLNVNDAEAVLIQRALETAGQNRTKAAELLGISVRTLRNKLNGPGKDEEA